VGVVCFSVHDIMWIQQLWTASYVSGKMRPLRVEFWGFWPRQLFAVLAILLAAAVLSVVLLPAVHGSFVSTHGPATAFRSRRLLLAICLWLSAVIEGVAGLFCAISPGLQVRGRSWEHAPAAGVPTPFCRPAILLC
jgi:hypothetical protein